MFEKLKWYALNVGMNKYLPMGAMAALAWLGTFMMAHAGILEQYGVTYGIWPMAWPAGQEPSGAIILIELDTFKVKVVGWIIAGLTIVFSAMQHHTTPVPPKPIETTTEVQIEK